MARSLHVLVVDDELAILKSTRLLLEIHGVTCDTVSRADDLFVAATERSPDVILHDLRMPGVDIVRHLERVRRTAATREAGLVLFSASMDLPEVAREGRLPYDALLEKPFSIPALLDAIRGSSERRRTELAVALPNA